MLLAFKSGLWFVYAIKAATPVSKVLLKGSACELIESILSYCFAWPISPLSMVFLSMPIPSQNISTIFSNFAICLIFIFPVIVPAWGFPD
jgi:hypothetical protein